MGKKITCKDIIKEFKAMGDAQMLEEMKRVGIDTRNAYGVSVYDLRRLARELGINRKLAGRLWATGILEARILASMIDEPQRVTSRQMESWVKDFDSWAVCDLCCGNLFDRTKFSWKKAVAWSNRRAELVKRAGFVLMAALAVHDKEAKDKAFREFLPIIKKEALDERNYVKKAVNWALRQIGKRNVRLNKAAIRAANEIKKMDSKSAKWIATDALRELESEKVQRRLRP